jgi:hypothetical protein
MLTKMRREPLAHFLLIGLAMFAVYEVVNPGTNLAGSPRRIEVTADDLRQLQLAFAAQWHRAPTAQEMSGLVESKYREEILYREALALGLDKEDTIVKRRMVQKMEFLAEDVSTVRDPTPVELRDWFKENSGRFAQPGRVSFRHLYYSFDRRREHARGDATRALTVVAGKESDLPATAATADTFMLQSYYGDRTPEQLAKEFGPGFAQALFQVKPRMWQGPIESGYGWHLVWVYSFTKPQAPALHEIEPDVKAAWIAERREESKRKSFEAMRTRYELMLPGPPAKGAEFR